MLYWQTLAAASIAALGASMLATPASAAPSGLQTLEFTTTSAQQPELLLVDDHGRRFRHYRRFRDDDDDFSIRFGFFPFGHGYGYRSYYYDDDPYVHCHKWRWRYHKRRCVRWHEHW